MVYMTGRYRERYTYLGTREGIQRGIYHPGVPGGLYREGYTTQEVPRDAHIPPRRYSGRCRGAVLSYFCSVRISECRKDEKVTEVRMSLNSSLFSAFCPEWP